ncbi:MAG: ribosome maturation factor RimP [Clostridia bacterium]|nr:ribosome maturation factor RimP [Clostridia bacterium]
MQFELSIQERAEEVIIPVVEKLGYEVVEIKFQRVGKKNTLTVFVHKKGGVTLDDCIIVNDALDLPLESADITNGVAYDLNVSSPGLDRPIVTDRDYIRNQGEMVEAIYIKPVGKVKKIVGELVGHDEDNIILIPNGKDKENLVPKSNVKVLQPYIDMKGLKHAKI